MALTKVVYTDEVTIIEADNLNDIQDSIIALEGYAVSEASVAESVGMTDIKVVTMSGITSLPKTFTVAGITSSHELVIPGYAYVSPSSSMGSDWNLTSGTNTVTISGTFSGSSSTTVIATFGVPQSKITGA